ncbi:hypothetical protein RUND412_009218 [Rhizina undulata]
MPLHLPDIQVSISRLAASAKKVLAWLLIKQEANKTSRKKNKDGDLEEAKRAGIAQKEEIWRKEVKKQERKRKRAEEKNTKEVKAAK